MSMKSFLDEQGREIFSGIQVALPLHFTRTKSIHEQIREMILAMKSVEREGFETFEDADDFDVGDYIDDFANLPSYEHDFDHLPDVSYEKNEEKKEENVKESKNKGTDSSN